jgi:hypothetical protein
MNARISLAIAMLVVSVWSLAASGCGTALGPAMDAPKKAGLAPADFPEVAVDLFSGMDGGVELTTDEIKGRNTWMIWTAGNEAFWDYVSNNSFGTVDLLKTLDSRHRAGRFYYYGLMNEPGFRQARAPDKHGLWLDEPDGPLPAGVDPRVYGRPSGVLGLRLFDNPDFDAAARNKWDAHRYYTDPNYYLNPKLVRPYRVGMSCAFCHVGPDPVRPPADPERPRLENLSSYVGSQYFWIGRIFLHNLKDDNFVWHLFNSSVPGALDTSLIATDNVNNPRTMNAIYEVGARLQVATIEEIRGDALKLAAVQPRMPVPHVLKDGADSVGILAALGRVYVNIGSFHDEWLRHFNLLVGGKRQSPFPVAAARANSVYWHATEARLENLAKFFLKAARPHRLEDAPGGRPYLITDDAVLTRGKLVFADRCASCHSSKQPKDAAPGSSAYTERMRAEVLKPDFRDNNLLSTDQRIPISEVKTNACAALATNATEGQIWDNFSSKTYKDLPAVGTIEVQHPLDGTLRTYSMPAGGRGYYRVPSLVSLWSSAPFLHNNALGKFTNDPSVAGRMEAFNDAVEKLLWPEKRKDTDCERRWGMPFCPPISRTTQDSYIVVNRVFLPKVLRAKLLVKGENELRIGPIPKGTPVNLLANINNELSADPERLGTLVGVILKAKGAFRQIERDNLDAGQRARVLRELVPDLLSVSKCPDFVVDRGHEFGADLSDGDKRALIEFLKTL